MVNADFILFVLPLEPADDCFITNIRVLSSHDYLVVDFDSLLLLNRKLHVLDRPLRGNVDCQWAVIIINADFLGESLVVLGLLCDTNIAHRITVSLLDHLSFILSNLYI